MTTDPETVADPERLTGVATRIVAAGGVVLRRDPSGTQHVLLVHRPRYDDWSLPKGKQQETEPAPVTAVREVAEETGRRIGLAAPLDQVRYPVANQDHPVGAEKSVSWWRADSAPHSGDPAHAGVDGAAAVSTDGIGEPDADVAGDGNDGELEVDQVAWLDVADAAVRLSYDSDRAVLDQALAQPSTTTVILVRHAKAINRKDWDGDDAERPLRPRGRTQARRLAPLLQAYGVTDLCTSPWRRCIATLQPYALQLRLRPHTFDVFNEDAGQRDPDGVHAAMLEICEQAVVGHRPIAVCGHRPVMGAMLDALDVPARKLATAECVVAHLNDTGSLHAVEFHRPRA